MTTEQLIPYLFNTRDQLHIWHLQTTSYAEHKALESLYETVVEFADKFAETLQGLNGGERIKFAKVYEDEEYDDYISDYQDVGTIVQYLSDCIDMLRKLEEKHLEILNIRDELVAELNKGIYLLTLK